MQLYFIRHAQSENNALWAQTGSDKGRAADPEITAVGRQQAQLLAQFLKGPDDDTKAAGAEDLQNRAGFGLTYLYTSLMRRAVATSAVVTQVLDLPLHALEDLHEWGGIYETDPETGDRQGLPGSDRAYFAAHYPDLVLPNSFADAGWWNRPFETRDQRPVRARRFLRDLLEKHGNSDDRVAVISHGGFYNSLMAALLNLPPKSDHLGKPKDLWFALNNTAITRIDFATNSVIIVYTNRVDFLPPELVT